jgi:transcriptional regulator with XRE-family HTH domain
LNASVNVPRILRGMKAKGWNVQACCAMAHVNNKTLRKILNGEVPKRLDALFRVLDGLEIPIEQAISNGAVPNRELRVIAGGKSAEVKHASSR